MVSSWTEEPMIMPGAHTDQMLPMDITNEMAIEWTILTLCIVTVIINPITLTAMIKGRLVMTSSVNVCITSLCFSDLLIGLSIFILHLPYLSMKLAAVDSNLRKARFVAAVCCSIAFAMSNFNGFLITVDRAIATLFPHKYKTTMTVERTRRVLVVFWLGTAVFFISLSAVKVFVNGGFWALRFPIEVLPASITTYVASPSLAVCLCANVILYAAIIRSLVKSGRKVHTQANSLSEKRSNKITRMVVMVIGIMLLGNLPIVVISAIPIPSWSSASYISYCMAFNIFICIGIVSTFMNNIIYVGRMIEFKKHILSLFCCGQITSVNQIHSKGLSSFRSKKRTQTTQPIDSTKF